MPGIKYITRVLRGVRFEKLNYVMGVVKQKSGHSKARTFCDILWCAARYGAGYYDYVMFGFYDMNGKQRDTYLTRVRNKKVCELMNQPGYGDEFDDKLRFNVRFADFLGRRTLNAAAATPDELSAFLQGLDCFFAKPSRGTCGNGIEKLRTADWPDAEKLLAYLKEKGLDVLEEPLAQHPDMARLHPQSVNTMRIVTDRVGDTVHIAYIVLKIGRGDGFCDNSGQGGVICRVDEKTGKICSVARIVMPRSRSMSPESASRAFSSRWYRRPWLLPGRPRSSCRRSATSAGMLPSRRTAPCSSRATITPERICASLRRTIRRSRASGRITRKF